MLPSGFSCFSAYDLMSHDLTLCRTNYDRSRLPSSSARSPSQVGNDPPRITPSIVKKLG